MASFAPIRGSKSQILTTPLVDGQFLIEAETAEDSENKIYLDVYDTSSNLQRVLVGGGGHTMLPDPKGTPAPDEDAIVDTVNNAINTNKNVASLFGIQRWSNVKTFRVVYKGTVGHTGIGEWQNILNSPTASDESSWGWWYNDVFKYLDNSSASVSGYDVDFSIKFDPANDEAITLGGYIIDTTTGYMCIKFANYITDPTNAKIIVDVTFTRNDIDE